MKVTEEMKIAERHRRYQLNMANDRIDTLGANPEYVQSVVGDVQESSSMKMALIRLMVGSHAHRGVPVE